MSKQTKKILKIVLPLAVVVFLIWYSYHNTTPEDRANIVKYVKEANYWWVALSLFFGVLSHLSRAYRWGFMLEPLGYKPKYVNSVLTVLIAYFANLGIPRSGEVFRATAISAYEDIPFEKAFGTIVAERIIDLIMLLLVIFVAFLVQTDVIVAVLEENNFNPLTIVGATVAAIVLLVVGIRIIRRSSHPLLVKVKTFMDGLLDGIKSVLTMKKKWAFIFHTFFIWTMYVCMFFVIKFTVEETTGLSLGAILSGFVGGAFAMSTTNGGLGVYPIAVSAIFELYGISAASGDAFGWIMWIAQTLMVVFFGTLSFLILPLYNRNRRS